MMRRWLRGKITRRVTSGTRPRYFSIVSSGIQDVERVSVRCGSGGSVCLDLHNLARVTSSDPLLIYLPPYSTASTDATSRHELPAFCRNYPTAVVNYRWAGYSPFGEEELAPRPSEPGEAASMPPTLSWPTPIHDTLTAYSWITENLTPPPYTRRDIYVYGSYLGASLATSLALTESHPHSRMAVRGFAAYNGIFNWTMFLPSHAINKQSKQRTTNILEEILGQPTDPVFQELKQHTETLFTSPGNLFDPFASPCLFFQTPGLLVPNEFNSTADPLLNSLDSGAAAATTDVVIELLSMSAPRAPRRSPLAFPPRKSTLKIPYSLLLHSRSPAPSLLFRGGQKRRKRLDVPNHFGTQAEELAALMRRSLEKLELKERGQWDEEFDGYEEIKKRVRTCDVGFDERPDGFELPGRAAEGLVGDWLEERMLRPS